MSKNDMNRLIQQLNEWEALADEARQDAEAVRDLIKAELLAHNTEEMETGKHIVRWTSVLSNRFDTTAFKREHAELYKLYTKQTASKRFSIA